MAKQTKAVRSTRPQVEKQEEATDTSTPQEKGEKLKADIDDLLDEIDDVLVENAEEFVSGFIQKGGE